MKSLRTAAAVLLLTFAIAAAAIPEGLPTGPSSVDHTKWVSECLSSMETIKPGMTRGDLLKVFTTEGGLSSTAVRTYVYRGCPYFKVRVEFTPVNPAVEGSTDKIKSISDPYLQWTISD